MKTVGCRLLGIYVSFFMFAFPSVLHAAAGWTDYGQIAELLPTSRHYYEVKLQVDKNPSGCVKSFWFYQDYETKGADKMFDTLLKGVESGKRVRVYVTGKCNVNGYSEFTAVGIVP